MTNVKQPRDYSSTWASRHTVSLPPRLSGNSPVLYVYSQIEEIVGRCFLFSDNIEVLVSSFCLTWWLCWLKWYLTDFLYEAYTLWLEFFVYVSVCVSSSPVDSSGATDWDIASSGPHQHAPQKPRSLHTYTLYCARVITGMQLEICNKSLQGKVNNCTWHVCTHNTRSSH